jgi:Flp pilus assembly pilin Flp
MKANRFKRDENGATNVDTILILGLVLAIILVLVYVGTSVSGWFPETIDSVSNWWEQNIAKPIDDGLGNLGLITNDETTMSAEDKLLKQMYENDIFILNSTDSFSQFAHQEFCAIFSETEGQTRIYDMGMVLNGEFRGDYDVTGKEKKISISGALMNRLALLGSGQTLNIEGELYDASIKCFYRLGSGRHPSYQVTITPKGV